MVLNHFRYWTIENFHPCKIEEKDIVLPSDSRYRQDMNEFVNNNMVEAEVSIHEKAIIF